MVEILGKSYLEMGRLPAVGNFQSGSGSIDLHLIWKVTFSLCPPKLRDDHTKTHTKRERAKQIMKCSIIGTQRTHLKRSSSSYSLCFWKCLLSFFSSGLNRECYQIKAMYHSVIRRITPGTHRQMPIAQLLSICDMFHKHIICLNLYQPPFVSVSALPLFD